MDNPPDLRDVSPERAAILSEATRAIINFNFLLSKRYDLDATESFTTMGYALAALHNALVHIYGADSEKLSETYRYLVEHQLDDLAPERRPDADRSNG